MARARKTVGSLVAKAALSGQAQGPQMQSVSSSAVAAVGYNARSRLLTVQWIKGGTYEYPGISKDVADALLSSNSVGETMNYIKRSVTGRKIG